MSNYDMDGSSFRNTMHSLNYGNVMEAAARNYMKETKADEEAVKNRGPIHYDLEDLEDVSCMDPTRSPTHCVPPPPLHRSPRASPVQVDIRLTPRVESARFQLVESTSLSIRWFQNVDLHLPSAPRALNQK